MKRVRVLLSVALQSTAFAHASAQAGQPTRPPSTYVAATRSTSECASVRARTASAALVDTAGLQLPVMRRMVLAPLPRPAQLVPATLVVDVRVSETGSVVRDSIIITGGDNSSYIKRLRGIAETYEFWPAVLDGCAVSYRVRVRYGPVTKR